jgi:hypothetical protein
MMGTHQQTTCAALHQGWGGQALVLAAVATTMT